MNPAGWHVQRTALLFGALPFPIAAEVATRQSVRDIRSEQERLPLEQWRNSLALLFRNLGGRYLMALKEVEAGNGPELS